MERSEMNFMEKGNTSSSSSHHHPYYHGEDSPTTTTTTTTSRGAELDLMDSSPANHHPQPDREKELGGLGLGTTSAMAVAVEREHMFDKVVTPSDVGKLNRLVIPKQHAEKYFPLDSSTNDKGLLLNFDDSSGKSWRFRYSYWNSSQSYVMTKGWSRFVKDKKLDPGDIVSFLRGKGHLAKDRLFIDWRRRPDHPTPPLEMAFGSSHNFSIHPSHHHPYYFPPPGSSFHRSSGWGSSTGPPPPTGLLLPAQAAAVLRGGDHYYHPGQTTNYRSGTPYNYGQSNHGTSTIATAIGPAYVRDWSGSHHVLSNHNPSGDPVIYFRPAAPHHHHQQQASLEAGMMRFSSGGGHEFGGGGGDQEVFLQSVPVVPGKAAAKRLRLFGVNMDCPISDSSDDDDEEHDRTILPSTTIGHHPHALMVPPPPPNFVQLRLHNSGTSSPQQLPHHHQMQFHSDYLQDHNDHDKGKGIQ